MPEHYKNCHTKGGVDEREVNIQPYFSQEKSILGRWLLSAVTNNSERAIITVPVSLNKNKSRKV